MPLKLRLNPELNPLDFADAYRRDRYVQVCNFLPAAIADHLAEVLARRTEWRLLYSSGQGEDTASVITRARFAALSPPERNTLQQGIHDLARRSTGFAYNGWPMITAYVEGWEPGHPLHAVTEFLQTDEVREFGRRVIGAERITKVDAQATLYAPGHFLTRHRDVGLLQERRAAYTLGFARNWQPDYGGLLAFLDDEMNIERALTPRFNVLTLFDGLRMHCVTTVAAFAPVGRYSITGWFRDDPAASQAP